MTENNFIKKLDLKKPLVIFDLETTGVVINLDKVVELSYLKISPNGEKELKTYRINPGIKIPQESIDVHGITNEEVAKYKYFKEYANELFSVFSNCFFAGFNVIGFDLPMIQKEFKEAGLNFQYSADDIIDAKVIFHNREKRDLTAAYKFYCGKEHTAAHSAEGDILATYEILNSQFERYPEINDEEFLRSIHSQRDERYVDSERKFYWRDGEAYFNFGKHKDKKLEDISNEDPTFLSWMLGVDFGIEVKEIVNNALNGTYPSKNSKNRV
ncbi:3'-5' exonuclease [Candidatus Azambacteria bacterium]|nr:3'-5' exonuclease [Candidatus Azambacteria bacterium]